MNFIIHHKNGDLYEYLGQEKELYRFRNLRTKKEGSLTVEQTERYFRINLDAMQLLSLNPNISELIHRLDLKIKI